MHMFHFKSYIIVKDIDNCALETYMYILLYYNLTNNIYFYILSDNIGYYNIQLNTK